MTGSVRVAGRIAAALGGAAIGTVIVLVAHEATTSNASSPSTRPDRTPGRAPSVISATAGRSAPIRRQGPGVVLAWSPQGLPGSAETRLEKLATVLDATTVRAGLDWIERSRTNDGAVIDKPGHGYAIPMEVAAVDPEEYARFVPPAERQAVQGLRGNAMLLSETSAELRKGGVGLRLRMRARTATVTGVISDVGSNGYEGLIAGVPGEWARAETFLLAHVKKGGKAAVGRSVRRMLSPGDVARVRAEGETPFLRYGDAVLPQLLIKESFGEFAAIPRADGTLAVDPNWVRSNIKKRSVPVLGEVACHRALFPQLRGALAEARSRGAAYTINPGQYGGCYGPRFISRDPTGRISHHAWGVAFDLNVADNPVGAKPNLDLGLVNVIEKWGFTWGGRWLIPDGMHFEWKRFP